MTCQFLKNNDNIQKYWNLQYPTSTTIIKAGNYDGFIPCNNTKDTGYITCNINGSITMRATGDHHRCEFRCINEFHCSDEFYNVLKVTCKLNLGCQKSETTVAQIHDNANVSGINKPLLRIAWIKNYNGIKNHFWAIVRNSYDKNNNSYNHYDIGSYSDEYIEWKISCGNNKISVYRNGEKKCSQYVSYYDKASLYFKFGIYNQDDGYDDNTVSKIWCSNG